MCFVQFVGKQVVSWGVFFEAMEPHELTYMTYTRHGFRCKGYAKRVMSAAREYRFRHYRGKKVTMYDATVAASVMFDKYSFYEA